MSRYRTRSDWTTSKPADARRVMRPFLRGTAIHWVGPAVPAAVYAGDEAAVAQYLRGVLRYHLSKGWSDIAYNLAVDTQGRVWDLRGLQFQPGANGDDHVNTSHLAVVALIGEGQRPTPEMLVGLRKAVRKVRLHYPIRGVEVVGHRDIRPTPTACPGRPLYLAIKADTFRVRRLKTFLARLGF